MGSGEGHTGAFARLRDREREVALIAMPDGMSERAAALAEPLAVALHGITRSGAAPGDTAMVFGAGPDRGARRSQRSSPRASAL